MLKGFFGKLSRHFLSFILLLFSCIHLSASSAVILQYHHVSEATPKSTSISPTQFTKHLQYFKDNQFTVIPLSSLVDAIKNRQPLKDKTIVITFDDAYQNIYTHAKPILDKFNYPYTIFINPSTIVTNENTERDNSFLSWKQIRNLSKQGVIIANHGFSHDSIARVPEAIDEEEWLKNYEYALLKSEQLIKDNTGKSWQYFAYPYGEYTVASQQLMNENGFVAFTQQSGAVGLSTDLSIIPRFPASQPYDKINSLRDKINSLPLNIQLNQQNKQTTFKQNTLKEISFTVEIKDFHKTQLACYVSGIGKQKIVWQSNDSFSITFNGDLPAGRVRCNCTAPSINEAGRYYWYSKPWFILKNDNTWYPL